MSIENLNVNFGFGHTGSSANQLHKFVNGMQNPLKNRLHFGAFSFVSVREQKSGQSVRISLSKRKLEGICIGYPAWIRTKNNASKGRCVTVTPRGMGIS
jgi:hypothetical protein